MCTLGMIVENCSPTCSPKVKSGSPSPSGMSGQGEGQELGSEQWRRLGWCKGKGSKSSRCVSSEAGVFMISHPLMGQSPLFCAGHIIKCL